MKAEDLMIGDWVLWKNKPVQIAAVSGIVYSFGQVDVTLAYCNDDKLLEKHDIKSVQPIPLTAEILEKNGFVYNDIPFEQSWQQYGLSLYAGGDGYRINCGENVALVIDSVHQLQHALRLCQIDKPIVL